MVLNKPHYVFRPSQLVRRVLTGNEVKLPWGHRITVVEDVLGRGIMRTGVSDLPTTETIWRLLDPGEKAVDAGANIGYMTSVMLARDADVIAIEPHPDTYQLLERNVSRWGKATLMRAALSGHQHGGELLIGEAFQANHGTATLSPAAAGQIVDRFQVETVTLDQIADRVDLLKLDIEGHELEAILGAAVLDHTRDIVFEDHDGAGSPLMTFLRTKGFSLRQVNQRLRGPALLPIGSSSTGWDPQTYLATRDLNRATCRYELPGWKSLRGN